MSYTALRATSPAGLMAASSEPQLPQKRFCSGFISPQAGQRIISVRLPIRTAAAVGAAAKMIVSLSCRRAAPGRMLQSQDESDTRDALSGRAGTAILRVAPAPPAPALVRDPPARRSGRGG